MAGSAHRNHRFHIAAPSRCEAELGWVAEVVFGRFLDLDFNLDWTDSPSLTISRGGRSIQTPITFFERADTAWLDSSSLPSSPPLNWRPASIDLSDHLLETETPVFFGEPTVERLGSDRIRFDFDLLGTIFFLLSRYEEGVHEDSDEHDRFPPTASMLDAHRLIERPIVDEYVEILGNAIRTLWPDLPPPPRSGRCRLTCDVDSLFDPASLSVRNLTKRILGLAAGRSQVGTIRGNLRSHLHVRRHGPRSNPYWVGVERLLDDLRRLEIPGTFYFIPKTTVPALDGDNRPEDPAVGELLRRIDEAGLEIGVHPGYGTYRDPDLFAESVSHLRRELDRLGIDHSDLGGRQHYLRWSTMTTPALCEASGLTHDSTLGYAQSAGFRCGTARDFPLYDLAARRGLTCIERPLILMDATLQSKAYGKETTGVPDSEIVSKLAHASRHYGGNFNVLWHNTSFLADPEGLLYTSIIEAIQRHP